MFIVRNFFYAVGIAFLFALQSVNPDKDVLRQFVLMLQFDNFWTVVKIGTLILCALDWSFSPPVSSTSFFDDLMSLPEALKNIAAKLMSTRREPVGGADLSPEFAKGTAVPKHLLQQPTQENDGAYPTPAADPRKTDQPFTERERLVVERLWSDSTSFTIGDMSDLTLRTSRQCAHELASMELYPDLDAVIVEDRRRSKLRDGNV